MRSLARGETIFRINAFNEYRRLYIARSLNLATTLWNKINSSPVRRSSSCSISSGGSRHFAALRNSLISLPLGPRRWWPRPWHWSVPRPARRGIRAAGLALTRFSHCRNVSVLPKKLTVCDCDNSGPQSQLCSARMHLAANSVHAFAPPVDPP